MKNINWLFRYVFFLFFLMIFVSQAYALNHNSNKNKYPSILSITTPYSEFFAHDIANNKSESLLYSIPEEDYLNDFTLVKQKNSTNNHSLDQRKSIKKLTGIISGRVTDEQSNPISNISVSAYSFDGVRFYWNSTAVTDNNGDYILFGLDTNDYFLIFTDTIGSYKEEGYSNEIPATTYTMGSKTPISVIAGQTTNNINESLSLGGTISGRVTGEQNNPLNKVKVTVYRSYFTGYITDIGTTAYTDYNGEYSIKGLSTGTYYLKFNDYKNEYITEGYSNEIPFSSDVYTKTAVDVIEGQTTSNINESLTFGGIITGQVTDNNNNPLPDVYIRAYTFKKDYFKRHENYVYTDSNGQYSLKGLYTGTYYLEFSDSSRNYIEEAYSGEVPFNWNNIDNKTAINITVGQISSNINASLDLGGIISGQVTDEQGNPLLDINVSVYISDGSSLSRPYSNVWTNANGEYSLTGLPGNTYYLYFEDYSENYIREGYKNEVPFRLDDISNKIAIQIESGQTISGINESLTFGGVISGKVTDLNNNPLPDISVYTFIWNGKSLEDVNGSYKTDSNGLYSIGALPSGSYYLHFKDNKYISEGYHDEVPFDLKNIANKTAIKIIAGETVSDINESMQPGGSISGQVTDQQNNPLSRVFVGCVNWPENNPLDNCQTETDANGNYLLEGLITGEYYLYFYDLNGIYLTEGYHNEIPFDYSGINSKTAISVTVEEVTNHINESLDIGGVISGKVTDEQNNPLRNISVEAYILKNNTLKRVGGFGYTDVNGNYTIGALHSGAYYLLYKDFDGVYITKGYQNDVPFSGTNLLNKTAVNVVTGETTSNIDTSMVLLLQKDKDSDGIPNVLDNCPEHHNILQLDFDSDLMGDDCDLDNDNDGLPDIWETENDLNPLDSNDASLDTDKDNVSNLSEYLTGTDPQDNQSNLDSLNLALNTEDFVWNMTGDSPWRIQNLIHYSGDNALQSGFAAHNVTSSIITTVTAVDSISFYWKVSAEPGAYFLKFYVDDIEIYSVDGNVDWQLKTVNLSSGRHTLRWTYSKNSSSYGASDAAWLDNISTKSIVITPILFLLQ